MPMKDSGCLVMSHQNKEEELYILLPANTIGKVDGGCYVTSNLTQCTAYRSTKVAHGTPAIGTLTSYVDS